MKEQFNNNYDKLLQYIKSQTKEISIQKVGIYDMTTIIDYSSLETKLIKTKQIIDSETI
jgi:hypothetical protein